MRLRLLEDGELWLVLYYPLVAGYALLPALYGAGIA